MLFLSKNFYIFCILKTKDTKCLVELKGFLSYSILDSEKEPDYRDVTIRTDVKVKELYDVEERLGT